MYAINMDQNDAGTQSIGAVATQKIQTTDLNLGFPSAYGAHCVARGVPPAYYPTRRGMPMELWEGKGLQADYHNQKREDANRMVNAKVQSTMNSRVRYVTTLHGMGDLPKPRLGQRRFANPSNGAYIVAPARQNLTNAPFNFVGSEAQFSGGVLRTTEGQAYGRRLLLSRVEQLNAINAEKTDFASQSRGPSSTGAMTESFNRGDVTPEIELNLMLQGLLDSLMISTEDASERLTRFDLATASKIMGLVFRLVPTGDADFIEDTQAKCIAILEQLNGMLDEDTQSAGFTTAASATALSLQVLFTKLNEYLTRMMGGAIVERQDQQFNPLTGQQEITRVLSKQQGQNLALPERVALSKNLVSSLGFSKLLKHSAELNDSGLLSAAERDNLFSSQQRQEYFDVTAPNFARRARGREDAEHDAETGIRRGDRGFMTDERDRFGMASGEYYPSGGRGVAAYAGESPEGDGAFSVDSAAPFPLIRRPRFALSDAEADARELRGEPRDVGSAFDPATGEFGIARAAPAWRPPVRPAAERVLADPIGGISRASELPRSLEGYRALAALINKEGGIDGKPITVSAGSLIRNVRRNFIKRLGLNLPRTTKNYLY